MTRIDIQSSIFQAIQQLSETQQQKLLDFINAMLGKKNGSPKNALVQFGGYFSKEDLGLMSAVIKDCETINLND